MSVVSGSKEITRFFGKSAVIATASDRDGPKKKIRGPSASVGMTQESQHDPPAPSPTGRKAAGRLSRENNGRGISDAEQPTLLPLTLLTGRSPHPFPPF
jgi:hypothetical protein